MPKTFQKDFPKSAFVKVLKEAGALRISDDATKTFTKEVEERIEKITQLAWKYARHAKRNTIMQDDVAMAIKELEK